MKRATEVFLRPSEIAKTLRVSAEKVLGWIRRGELRAVNVGNGTRPRYRVSPASFDEFLQQREVQQPPRRVRRPQHPPEGGPIDPILGEQLLKKKQAVKYGNTYYRVWNGITLYY